MTTERQSFTNFGQAANAIAVYLGTKPSQTITETDDGTWCYLDALRTVANIRPRLSLHANSGLEFQLESFADMTKKQALMGPWIYNELERKGIVFEQSATKTAKREAMIAKLVLDIDWQNWNTLPKKKKKSVKDAYESVKNFMQDLSNSDVKGSVKKYNSEHLDEIQDYQQRRFKINGDAGKDKGDDTKHENVKRDQSSPPDDNPHNLIYFGAPGTGKSFKLKVAVEGEKNDVGSISQDEKTGLFVDVKDGKVIQRRYERVTFYPTYSYAQFVGCYKPVMHGNEIAYEFVPGPFLRVLVNALNEKTDKDGKKKNWCLVIEEINRANAAAVFGDVFQLLDRKDNGESEYDIAASEDIRRYLTKEVGNNLKTEAAREFLKVEKDDDGKICLDKNGIWKSCSLRIPSNMYIWATMNSADQGVFPLDTAFKRRWEFEYIDINNGEDKSGDGKPKPEEWTIEGKEYKWNMVRKFINGLLSLHGVNEDKLMGARFVTASGKIVATKSFESKVLMYLWEDAGRMCRKEMFGDNILTYSGLVEKWENSGIVIFSNDTKKDDLKKLKDGEKLKDWYDKNANKEEK